MSAPLLLALWVSARSDGPAAPGPGSGMPRPTWVDGRWRAAFEVSPAQPRDSAAPRHRRTMAGGSGVAAGATG